MHQVRMALNQHWYSHFWLRQFWQLYRQGEIKLRPILMKRNPTACFYFELDGRPCLIDVSDHKTLAFPAEDYFLYFKANFSPQLQYPANVHASWNGTTLTRLNKPVLEAEKIFDLVWLTGIGGGRQHKVAMFLALASLPLKKKLAARLITPDDWQWAPVLEQAGVEVWKTNLSYKKWLAWNKQAKWCVLARGKHDCLSFKMIDYMSIGAGVLADYPPTTQWPVPVEKNKHFLSFDFSGPDRQLTASEFDALCEEYKQKAQALLPQLQDAQLRHSLEKENLEYFKTYIQNGQAARSVLQTFERALEPRPTP